MSPCDTLSLKIKSLKKIELGFILFACFFLYISPARAEDARDDASVSTRDERVSPSKPLEKELSSKGTITSVPSILKKESKTPIEEKIINSGDLISVTVTEDGTGPQVMLVDEQGNITLPYAGNIHAKGKTYQQLAEDIRVALLNTYYTKATVNVEPASQQGTRGRIFVLGQVAYPGPVKIPTDEILTASRAILQVGLTQYADLTRVSIVRKDPADPAKDSRITINVSAVINNGHFDEDVIVRANDMIFVPSKGESIGQVLMSGAIRQPGPLEIPIGDKFMLTDAIFRAGGFADFADKEHVKIIRKDPQDDKKQETLIVNVARIMDKGERQLDKQVKNDDVVIVPEKWFNF